MTNQDPLYELLTEAEKVRGCLQGIAWLVSWGEKPVGPVESAAVSDLIAKLTAALRSRLDEPRCHSCGARVEAVKDMCTGCKRLTCYVCVEAFSHDGDMEHGSGDPSHYVSDQIAGIEQLGVALMTTRAELVAALAEAGQCPSAAWHRRRMGR